MKATVDRRALVAALKIVTPAVAKGGSLPVLTGVRIEATSTGVDLCCSSLQFTAATIVADPENVTPGVVIPPATLLARVVEKMAGELVTIDADDPHRITVTSGETVAQLKGHDPAMWPDLPEADADGHVLTGGTIDQLERILPFASTDGQRLQLCTVHIGEGRACCTDTFRLGVVDGLPPELGPALVPIEAWRTIVKAAGSSMEVSIDERNLTARTGPHSFTTRLAEGNYPPYQRMLDLLDLTSSWTVARVALVESLARLSTLGGDAHRTVTIGRDGDKLRLATEDRDVGSIDDVIPVAGDFEGPMVFVTRYLGEMLAALENDEVRLDFDVKGFPVLCKADELTVMVVPVRPETGAA